MLTPNTFSMNWVTIPIVPSVAMKAKASGMPPKFAATPENVPKAERIQPGVPLRLAAYAIRRPSSPPRSAVVRLIRMLSSNASRRFDVRTIDVTLSTVKPPPSLLNAPIITVAAGRTRNTVA